MVSPYVVMNDNHHMHDSQRAIWPGGGCERLARTPSRRSTPASWPRPSTDCSSSTCCAAPSPSACGEASPAPHGSVTLSTDCGCGMRVPASRASGRRLSGESRSMAPRGTAGLSCRSSPPAEDSSRRLPAELRRYERAMNSPRDGIGPLGRPSSLGMGELEREQLLARHLADLHSIANKLGIERFRLLRKVDLVNAILDRRSLGKGTNARPARGPSARRSRRRRGFGMTGK